MWPSAKVLKQMHDSQYILHAAGRKLSHVPVEKTLLPHSDDMSPQGTHVDVGPDGTVYVKQSQILCKSTDEGRTWTARPLTDIENIPGGALAGPTGRYVHWCQLLDRTGGA